MPAKEEPVSFELLKAWVAEQERYAASHGGQPAPLTAAQRKAIKVLSQPLIPAEPKIGDRNWVGMLNEFVVKNQPITITYDEGPLPAHGASNPRFTCTVRVKTKSHRFTSPSKSSLPGTTAALPSFVRKQDAKHFAARCACKQLVSMGMMKDLRLADFEDGDGDSGNDDDDSEHSGEQEKGMGESKSKVNATTANAQTAISNPFARVQSLCAALGIPQPTYDLHVDHARPNKPISGSVHLDGDPQLRDTRAEVKDCVMPEAEVRKVLASMIVTRLEEEKSKREKARDAFFKNSAGGGGLGKEK